jgi:DNA polymerase I-like protein with 3'-5' exonuclease and polymerase domains
MFLLLAGSTEMARALIVDEFLENHDDWRHLALEDIQDQEIEGADDMEDEDVFGFQMAFMTMVACECAKEAHEKGHRILITCPESEMLEGIYSEIEDPIISVFLGIENDADGFDHVINSSEKSMVEVCKQLNQIIQATPA